LLFQQVELSRSKSAFSCLFSLETLGVESIILLRNYYPSTKCACGVRSTLRVAQKMGAFRVNFEELIMGNRKVFFIVFMMMTAALLMGCSGSQTISGNSGNPAAPTPGQPAAQSITKTQAVEISSATAPSKNSPTEVAVQPASNSNMDKTTGQKGVAGGLIISTAGKLEYLRGDARDDGDFVTITGEIVNHAAIWADNIRIDITLYGPDGSEIGKDFVYTSVGGVAPETTVPFKYLRDDKKINGKFAGYALAASALETKPKPAIEIQNFTSASDAGFFKSTGTIVNKGSDVCQYPHVLLAGRMADGRIYDLADITFTQESGVLASLGAGAKADFSGTLDGASKVTKVAAYAGCQ
jgi:hypothetical protein